MIGCAGFVGALQQLAVFVYWLHIRLYRADGWISVGAGRSSKGMQVSVRSYKPPPPLLLPCSDVASMQNKL